jgi:hypothetical protein
MDAHDWPEASASRRVIPSEARNHNRMMMLGMNRALG